MAVKKYAAKATIDDLEEVKNSLRQLLRKSRRTPGRVLYCKGHPVPTAVIIGAVKLMEIIFNTSLDMNARIYDMNAGLYNWPLFYLACRYGQTEIVRMMISCSKEKSIDLNAEELWGRTGLHAACSNGRTETVQVLLKNWREFGIDIKARDENNETALELIKHHHGEPYVQIKKMLEDEYAKMDVTESI